MRKKTHHLHGKCLQQLNLSNTPHLSRGEKDDRPQKIKIGGLPDSGATYSGVETDYCRVTASSDYKLKAPLTFCLQAW